MQKETVRRCAEILKAMDQLEAEYDELVGDEGWDEFVEAREWLVPVPRSVQASHYFMRGKP